MSDLNNSDGNDIFGPMPLAFWFSTVFGTKMMLLRISKLWKETCPIKLSNFDKRVSSWHTKSLIPLTKHFTEKYKLPIFAVKAVDAASNLDFDLDVPKCLHILLLQEASKEILDIWGKGAVGEDTAKKVSEWFTLMESVVESRLFGDVQDLIETEDFLGVLESYSVNKDRIKSALSERPFFDPQTLFIMVAHMVYMCTQCTQHGGLSSIKTTKLSSSEEDIDKWEEVSGSMFADIFRVDEHQMKKNWEDEDWTIFALPYKSMKEATLRLVIPSPATMHDSVIQAMMAQFQKKAQHNFVTTYEGNQLIHLDSMNGQTKSAHIQCVNQSKSSEKFRKNYVMKRKREKLNEQDELGAGLDVARSRKPKGKYDAKPPTKFQRDIFLMGPHSRFHKKLGVSNVSASSSKVQFKSMGQYRQIPTRSLLITTQAAQNMVVEDGDSIVTQDGEGKKVGAEAESVTVTQDEEEEKGVTKV